MSSRVSLRLVVATLAFAGGGAAFLFLMSNGREQQSFEEQCRSRCGTRGFRVETSLLNPFLDSTQRRNVRDVRCVCG